MSLRKRALFVVMSACILFPIPLLAADGWDFEMELYVLGTSISGDAGIGRAAGAGVDIDFGDILENLHMAGMAHFEAIHESGWGTALDYSFMDLRDDLSGPKGGVADFKIRQGVFEANLLYRVVAGKGTVDYLTGIRWWDNDLKATIDPAALPGSRTAQTREDWADLFVGARWTTPISEKFKFMARGDVGGLGLEADFTTCLFANFRYTMTDNWLLDFGYKALWVDYESGTKNQPGYFAYDTVTHGPLVGVIYSF